MKSIYHRVKWENVCRDREEGGLGLKNIEVMNNVMVINQMWGNKEARTSVWIDWLEKYWCKGKHWWEDEVNSNNSWVLKRLAQCKVIGLKCISVTNNTMVWRGHGDGFVVKDTYNTLIEHKSKVDWYRLVWNDFNSPRDSFNAWLVVQNKMATRDRMSQWGFTGEKTCVLCGILDESRDHLHFECTFSYAVWIKVLKFLLVVPPDSKWDTLIPWFNGLKQERLKTKMIAAAATRVMNGVWKARNMKIFHERNLSPAQIAQEAIRYLKMKLRAIKMDGWMEADISWLRHMRILV